MKLWSKVVEIGVATDGNTGMEKDTTEAVLYNGGH